LSYGGSNGEFVVRIEDVDQPVADQGIGTWVVSALNIYLGDLFDAYNNVHKNILALIGCKKAK
jgi:hypothetical protein